MPLEGHRSIQGMLEDTTAQKVKLIVLETNFEQTVLKFILFNNEYNHHKLWFLESHFYTVQEMKFLIKDFCSKCDLQETADLVTFTEEILNGKLHFSCTM